MQWLSFYKNYFPALKESQQKQNVVCPFHVDSDPSMSLDLESGLYYCHACKEGGDVFKFYMKQNSCSFTAAKNAITGNEKTVVLTMTEAEVAHTKVLVSDHLQSMLFVKRGWTLDTIKKFKLGWQDERVTIPILDSTDNLANIRKYDVLHKSKEKFTGVKGYNMMRLFPLKNLEHDVVILFAGEPDTILADQFGLPAVTFTGGEGNFKESLLVNFKNKKVYICYDVDAVGRKAAETLSSRMIEYAKETYIISLPHEILPQKGDFTDFVFQCIDKKIDFNAEWGKVVEKAILKTKETVHPEIQYEDVDFYSGVDEKYYNKDITFQAITIGKGLSPFLAPKKVIITCDSSKGDSCKTCKVSWTGGSLTLEIKDEELLDLVKCTQTEQKTKIKTMAGIDKCSFFNMEFEMQAVEEVFISPTIDSEKIDRQFTLRRCYTKGHNIQLNKTYRFYGKTISDAKSQEATHYFTKQIPELTALDKFKLTEDDVILLRKFQPEIAGLEGVTKKIDQISKDLAYNVPELITGRDNLITAYDLVFHSVLRFRFLGSMVEKGWTELLVLGDTRTGKTKTVNKLCKHYRVGEYITLESATLAGLVGGVATVGRDSTFSWGVLPVNDGRLVILDEVNGLDTREISNLSSIRDSGVAERTVVGSTRKTSARVRLVWISNPRSSNVRISYYSSGVEAIKELLGRAEDIARLDFAMIVAKEDVDVSQMNQLTYNHPDHIFTSELCNKLVMWAWSRKERNVHFTDEAEKAILHYAIEMSEKYSDAIPIVQGSVQRIKLAKLSLALAVRLFSTEDGIKVIVKKEHVEYIVQFLYSIFDSQYFGYKDYSVSRKEESIVSSEGEVEMAINDLQNPASFIDKMLATNTILFDDLGDFTGREREQLKMFKHLLVINNCLKRRKQFFVKTPEFIKLLKHMNKKRKAKK